MKQAPPRRPSTLISIVAMLIFSVFRRALGLISISVLSRVLTPTEVGSYAFVQTTGQTFVGVMRLGALQGLHVLIARRIGDVPKTDVGALLGTGVVICISITLAGAGLMIALADPISRYIFGQPELAAFVIAAAVFFAGQFLSRAAYVGFAGMDMFVNYTYYATVVGIATVITTICGALVFGVQGAIWGFAGMTLLGVPIYVYGLVVATRRADVQWRISLRWDYLRQIFAIGLPFYAAGVFLIPAQYWSQGLVNRFGGLGALADLRIVLAMMALVEMIPQAISGPIISLFSEREGKETGRGASSALEHMRWLWIFALVSGGILAAVWPLAVTILFGSSFPAVAATGHLAIIAFIPTIVGTSLSAGILVGGRTMPLIVTGILQTLALIVLALILIEPLGLTGFFLAQAGAAIAAVVMWLVVLGRQTGKPTFRPWMAPLALATVVLCIVMAFDAAFAEPPALRLFVSLITLPTFIAAIAFSVLSADERSMILGHAITSAQRAAGKLKAARRMNDDELG